MIAARLRSPVSVARGLLVEGAVGFRPTTPGVHIELGRDVPSTTRRIGASSAVLSNVMFDEVEEGGSAAQWMSSKMQHVSGGSAASDFQEASVRPRRSSFSSYEASESGRWLPPLAPRPQGLVWGSNSITFA